jgi:hypothetical protein
MAPFPEENYAAQANTPNSGTNIQVHYIPSYQNLHQIFPDEEAKHTFQNGRWRYQAGK